MVYYMYKISNFFYKIKLLPIAYLIKIMIRILFSCEISYKTKIGKKVKFEHNGLGIVIHEKAFIGDNCTILQNVTIGGRSNIKELPVIGNNVLIGAGCIIIGNVKIGNNAKIGAGSVVVKNVPENAVVVGNPAKVIKVLNSNNSEANNEKK